jgi:sec-independent protein translocase protein TatA
MLGHVGFPELMIVLVIAVLIFGPKRLPQFGKAIGETIREFRGVRKQLDDLHGDAEDICDTVRRV